MPQAAGRGIGRAAIHGAIRWMLEQFQKALQFLDRSRNPRKLPKKGLRFFRSSPLRPFVSAS